MNLRPSCWDQIADGYLILNTGEKHEGKRAHGSILQVSYLYFPKGGRISIMSKTNIERNSNEY
jgi:hypothetical protein